MTLLAGGLAALLAGGAGAWAGQPGESKRKELGRIQRELQETRQSIERFRKQEQSLRQEADRLEDDAERARRKLSSIQGDLGRTESRRKDLRTRIGALKNAESLWRPLLAAEAAEFVMERASGEDGFGPSGLWRARLLRGAIIEKAVLLAALGGAASKTSHLDAVEQAVQRRLGDAKALAAAEKLRKEVEFQGKKAEAEGLKEKTQAAISHAVELSESARELQRMIESITRLSRVASPSGTLNLTRHSLPWPAEGRVVSRFGKQKDPKTGSWMINQGVRLETAGGAGVRAVASGSVIFAGPFRSYGRVLIVNHGDFFSVYGELGEILKKKGAQVVAGEAIATAAPGKFYFEIRSGLGASDPLLWLVER
ncbi:MAG: peptidoglycan DD-metalloendopeptidase family protein [Elusimicrobia bacterium]|nr:peptidoglycan DD-metalloendopeptidase family protein [Elusimicrobiota bacterium]